ncbi:MAG: urease accessory protein UreD [Betaproteobacteria bacterium]
MTQSLKLPAETLTPHQIAPLARWVANLDLGYVHNEFGTVLKMIKHEGPLRVQKALYPEGAQICHTVIVHPPAGIAGGDELNIRVEIGDDCQVVLSTPSATKWYKSFANPSAQYINVSLGDNAQLDWLPQENLFFNEAKSSLSTRFDVKSSSSLILWDMTMLGRKSSNEIWQNGWIQLNNQIYLDGKLLWVEQGKLSGDDPLLNSLVKLGKSSIFGSLIAIGPDCKEDLLEHLHSLLTWDEKIKAGATYLQQGVLIVRVVSENIEEVRNLLIKIWKILRPLVHHKEAQDLRLWAL